MIDISKTAAMILKQYGAQLSRQQVNELIENVDDLQDLAEEIYELGPPFNIWEADILSRFTGNINEKQSFERDGDLWTDDILNAYAEHIFNYAYTYNDEALKVDPTTDTTEEHIGPMAQDLEKVNPAVVQEDPESGYKTVDTGRLALMNAGAIADLARRLVEIEQDGMYGNK